MQIKTIFDNLWQDYISISPSTKEIHDLFLTKENVVYNDHVAFRTFQGDFGIDFLAQFFLKEGYQEKNDYHFTTKKLYAKHYEHEDPKLPKIFISELLSEEFSPFLQETVSNSITEIRKLNLNDSSALYMGRKWPATYATYQKLAEESEYAAWLYAFGYRANHFTVNVNLLENFNSIEEVNQFIESHQFELNESGGKIKGGQKEMLEQSSTKAKKVLVKFDDSAQEIPACYYEFAKRYEMPDGKLYQGFVAASADKIFESTNRY